MRQHNAGTPAEEVSATWSVAATFYNWKNKYAHMGVAELREVNDRLKRLVGDLTLDTQILSDLTRGVVSA